MIKKKIKIYNSLTKKKEIFIPNNPNYISMYVCGPTVYDYIHLGNCRTFIFFDIIYRYFKHLGYKIRYVRNITDVGHLENDFDNNSQDKIIKKSYIENIEPMEIIQKYFLNFHKILYLFNTLSPNIEPTATGHIIEQIELIKKIIKNKYAYEMNGSVYFNIKLYNTYYKYGIISGNKIYNLIKIKKSLKEQEKINIQDFALWKKANNTHIMNWKSPWGIGFPGWHTECVAMSLKYLGNNFDIHGGGIDLKFPHHDCELAQSYAIYGKPLANYWVHTNILTLNNKKMSKSTGNLLLPIDIFNGKNEVLLNRGFHPIIVKFSLLKSHYRSILNFSQESLLSAEKNYFYLLHAINDLNQNKIKNNSYSDLNIIKWQEKCYDAINDDFNTPLLISYLLYGAKYINLLKINKNNLSYIDLNILKKTMNIFFFDILGLKDIKNNIYEFNENKNMNKSLLNIILFIRNKIRKDKNWKLSDLIREKLNNIGIYIQDIK